MKLHILSDLHTEFASFDPPATDADVVVLAGDIGVGHGGIAWAAEVFGDSKVMYVPGNHEYFGRDIGFAAELAGAAPDTICVLDNEQTVIDEVRFLGCTLWTDFELHGEAHAWTAREHARRSIEDYSAITKGNRRLTPEDTVALHAVSRDWLEEQLARPFDGATVVVTHHLPAMPSIARRYTDSPLNPAFASRLEDVIEAYGPTLWIHGHTHVPCDYRIFDTRVVCNPRGYPSEAVDGFRPDLVVAV